MQKAHSVQDCMDSWILLGKYRLCMCMEIDQICGSYIRIRTHRYDLPMESQNGFSCQPFQSIRPTVAKLGLKTPDIFISNFKLCNIKAGVLCLFSIITDSITVLLLAHFLCLLQPFTFQTFSQFFVDHVNNDDYLCLFTTGIQF